MSSVGSIPDIPLTKRVLSMDVGIRTLSVAITGYAKSTNDLVIEYWGKDDILEGRSQAKNCLQLPTDKLCQFISDFLSQHWSIYNARPIDAIVIEQQPARAYNFKMRVMSYVLIGCLRTLLSVSYGAGHHGDTHSNQETNSTASLSRKLPPIYYQSGKAKLSVFAKTYKPPMVQTTLVNLLQPLSIRDSSAGNTNTENEDVISMVNDHDNSDEDDDADDEHGSIWANWAEYYDSEEEKAKAAEQLRREKQRQESARYRANKKHAVEQTLLILQEEKHCKRWITWFNDLGSKKDDVSDTLLQAIYYLRHGRTQHLKNAFGGALAEGKSSPKTKKPNSRGKNTNTQQKQKQPNHQTTTVQDIDCTLGSESQQKRTNVLTAANRKRSRSQKTNNAEPTMEAVGGNSKNMKVNSTSSSRTQTSNSTKPSAKRCKRVSSVRRNNNDDGMHYQTKTTPQYTAAAEDADDEFSKAQSQDYDDLINAQVDGVFDLTKMAM